MWRHVLFLSTLLLSAAWSQVEVRDSEVWITRGTKAKQLTHDGKSKLQAVLAPSRDRVAYYEQCPQSEHCTPSVVIVDLDGHRVKSFRPTGQHGQAQPCASILSISWPQRDTIATECHINPSLGEYIETNVSTGRTTRDLLGYGFTPSPDRNKIAHVGWIVHFAPPYVQSNYLQVDNTTIYPLPKGMKPVMQTDSAQLPPSVVVNRGLVYSGIHDFVSGFFWSPDSKRIAFIDSTYDWTAKDSSANGPGEESNRRYSVAIVSLSGEVQLLELPGISEQQLRQSRLMWSSSHRVSLHIEGKKRDFTIP